jgi:hypothetical protein
MRTHKKRGSRKIYSRRHKKNKTYNGGSDDTCNICLQEFTEGENISQIHEKSNSATSSKTKNKCFGKFHTTCIRQWYDTPLSKQQCPLCKEKFTRPPLEIIDQSSIELVKTIDELIVGDDYIYQKFVKKSLRNGMNGQERVKFLSIVNSNDPRPIMKKVLQFENNIFIYVAELPQFNIDTNDQSQNGKQAIKNYNAVIADPTSGKLAAIFKIVK